TSAENPNNPYYEIGSQGQRYPEITAITSLGKDAYQVSFRSITKKQGTEPKVEYYTALVRYTFTYTPLSLGDRWENGLAFAATPYRTDQELSRYKTCTRKQTMTLKTSSLIAALAVGASLSLLSLPAFAAKTPNALATENRVKQVAYDPHLVYEL